MGKKHRKTIDKKIEETVSKIHNFKLLGTKSISFITKSLAATAISAIVLYVLGRYILCPSLDIRVSKAGIQPQEFTHYDISISNHSNYAISFLSLAFKFDDRYPIKKIWVEDIGYKSGIKVRKDMKIEEISSKGPALAWSPLVSGFVAETDRLAPHSSGIISVIIDTTYNGNEGDVFPIGSGASLRDNSYSYLYSFDPFGILSFLPVEIRGINDFSGKKTRADNTKLYTQKWRLPDGRVIFMNLKANGETKDGLPARVTDSQSIYVLIP